MNDIALAVALADRRNMAYMGTTVTGGSGVGLVAATGKATAIGAISELIGTARTPETPMQRQLDHLGARLALASGAVCLAVFGMGMLRGYGRLAMLKAAISLGVAAIPEGLGTVATTTLAMGIRDMRTRKVAVRRLDAVETLGSVRAICLDKTGTLTENRMTVVALQVNGRRLEIANGRYCIDGREEDLTKDPALRRLWQVAILCNDTEIDTSNPDAVTGSPTEGALLRAAAAMGVDVAELQGRFPRQATRARAELRPYMATYHKLGNGSSLVAVKGSPSHVLDLCDRYLHQGDPAPLNAEQRGRIRSANDAMAADSLRVLGLAYAEGEFANGAPENLIWLGLIGMADPIRPELDLLMGQFHQAGIQTIMITGDQRATAEAIGRRLNLGQGESLEILDAEQLEKLDSESLRELVKKVHVFARVTPAHKLRIVQTLQKAGMVVAMTGDGINDGPALRAADIGIAMGHGGTDAARSVADVVLEDDNLHTMLVAVEQGRTLYDNIRKAIRYLVATNCSEIMVMAGGIGLGLGAPLTPMQLLWINLVTDIFPALALSLEPPAPDVLSQPPRDPAGPIIRREDLPDLGIEAILLSAAGLSAFAYGRARYGSGPAAAGIAFQTLAGAQLLHAVSSRSEHSSIFRPGDRPSNRALNLAIGGSLGLQLFTQMLPPLRQLLGLGPLALTDLLVIGAGAVAPLLVNEARKTGR